MMKPENGKSYIVSNQDVAGATGGLTTEQVNALIATALQNVYTKT